MEVTKRRKLLPAHLCSTEIESVTILDGEEEEEPLLPALPNHLSILCLSKLPPSLLFSVCRSWRQLLYSPSFPPFFSLYVFLSMGGNENPSIEFFSLDPLSISWRPLPPPPSDPPLNLHLRHPSFLSRHLSVQSLTVSNHLVLLAGTTEQFSPALSRPLVFHPETAKWFFGPQFSTPRRWCVAGAVGSTVYVASGIGAKYCASVARSMEQWKLDGKGQNWKWESLKGLKDGRYSREAVEGIAIKGKLCIVNIKGFALKEGVIYDTACNTWEEMPIGMLAGWNGPAVSMDEESMYVVDEARGILSEYDGDSDRWEGIIELPELKQAEQIAAGRGKICVVAGNGKKIIVVDVTSRPPRFWAVDLPCGQRFLGVHVLPRMSSS